MKDSCVSTTHHRVKQHSREANCTLAVTCSRDPIGYGGSPFSLYEYGGSTPVIVADPSGEEFFTIFIPSWWSERKRQYELNKKILKMQQDLDMQCSFTFANNIHKRTLCRADEAAQDAKLMIETYAVFCEAAVVPVGVCRRGAFREAKRRNGIPMSKQPDRVVPSVDRRGNPQPGKIYEFDMPDGTTKRIRDDCEGHRYPDDPDQDRGPHFNDDDGEHYDYDDPNYDYDDPDE